MVVTESRPHRPGDRSPGRLFQIKRGARVAIVGAPLVREDELRAHAVIVDDVETAEVVIVVLHRLADLPIRIATIASACDRDALTWIVYPKHGGVRGSDLRRDELKSELEPLGIKQIRQIGLDDDWTAVRYRSIRNVRARKSWP